MEVAPTFAASLAKRPAVPPLWTGLILVTVLAVFRSTGSVDPDVAWQLWIAHRLNAGAHLYRDIIEVNPPLWFWMARPVDFLARLLSIRPEAVLSILLAMLVAPALAATDRLLPELSSLRRTLLLSYIAVALLAVPWVHFGQREQIVLIATLPYAALAAARRRGSQVAPAFAAAIGAGAALGFALKHYFLLVPISLEFWLLLGSKDRWRPLRPETQTMVLAGALYACAIALWSGVYLTRIVPLVSLAYGAIGAPTIIDLFGPSAILGLALLGFTATQWRSLTGEGATFASALLICAAAFAGAYFIQSKGWPYHTIPLIGCASLSLAALLAEQPAPPRIMRIIAPALLALPALVAMQEALHADEPKADVFDAVSGLRSGDSVGFLATDNATAWSVTLQRGFRYPSRYMSFWMLNAVVRNELRGNPNPRLSELGRLVVSQTIDDFRCAPPVRLVVARPSPGETGFDILSFFERDPDFTKLMKHYRRRSWTTLETFDRVSDLTAPNMPCRSGFEV